MYTKAFLAVALAMAIPQTAIFAAEPVIKTVAAEPNLVSRNVSYHDRDVIEIAAQIHLTTMIVLPKEEKIVDATVGNPDDWGIQAFGNLAYIRPGTKGSRTNINIINASGNVYSFYATEISGVAGAHADLKIFVTPGDGDLITALHSKPRFVLADDVAEYQKAAADAKAALAAERAKARAQAEKQESAGKVSALAALKHDYKSRTGKADAFNVSAIFEDGRQTYIDANPQEPGAVYELKDGKPNLIDFEYHDGRYTFHKVVNQGYIEVGKARLEFRREE